MNIVLFSLYILFYITTFICCVNSDSNNNIKSIPLKYSFHTYDLFIWVPFRHFKKDFEIDMSIHFLWMDTFKRTNDDNVTSTEQKDMLHINGYITHGELYYGDFQINDNIILTQYPFYVINEYDMPIFDSFPLGYFDYKNTTLRKKSPLYLMYNEGIFNKISFGLEFHSNEAKLHLGGIPLSSLIKWPYKTSCTIYKDNSISTWGCMLNTISIDAITYDVNEYAFIQSNIQWMFLPKDIVEDAIIKKVYGEYIKSLRCKRDDDDSIPRIMCNCSIKNELPNVVLVYGGIKFTFTPDDYFEEYVNNKCINLISYITEEDELQSLKYKIIFGIPFWKKYMSYFNYETGEITFYSNKPFDDNNNNIKYIYYIIIFIILCGSVINLPFIIITKQNKNTKYTTY